MTDSPTASSESLAPLVAGPLGLLMLGALGVVYGDIGTSPLYTFKTALEWAGGPVMGSAAGMLSLIVWTLIITTSVKYVGLVMRADNHGEGGILALMARLSPANHPRRGLIAIGVLGAALLFGDGAITPAISVLSALEGLKDPLPAVTPYVVPLAVVILLGLFTLQRRGTAVIGRLFGPVMVLWFLVIGILGLTGVFRHPQILWALDPRVGVQYLATHGFAGFTVLGAVFLSATGAEALFADMGHFGAKPIRLSWYGLVLPTLLLNYAGQAALVAAGDVGQGVNPFFALGPAWLRLPLVALATVATVIASQSIISGVFSMTRQAIQLGLSPRMHVVQTSASGYGQIYVAPVNWILMVFTIGLTIGFGSSDRLAAAFGIAVSLTMLLTTLLMYKIMREQWKWSLGLAATVAGFLAVVDACFASANLTKVAEGGWVPLVTGAGVFGLMEAWRTGRASMERVLSRETMELAPFIASTSGAIRVEGTAVFLSRRADLVPVALLHNLKHCHVLHERNIILSVETVQEPRVPALARAQITALGGEFYQVKLHYGFMEQPDVPMALDACAAAGLEFEMMRTSFFLSRASLIQAHRGRRPFRRVFAGVFAWMHRNETEATRFFVIPSNRIVELGTRVGI